MSPLPDEPRTYPQLVAAWASAVEPFADLAESLTPEQWQAPSILPGWTNADIVAHVVGIERNLLGEPTPELDLDWDALPHADDLFSRYTELDVAARREMTQDEVCAELRAAIAARRELLVDQPDDLGEVVSGPGGWQLPRGVVMRMRCFDIWMHDQDIRAAIARPGDETTDAAWVAAGQMLAGLPRTWARDVSAPHGCSALVRVTGPQVEFTAAVTSGEDGRGHQVDPQDIVATTALTMDWMTFAGLSGGRNYADPGTVQVEGDPELGQRLVANLNVAP